MRRLLLLSIFIGSINLFGFTQNQKVDSLIKSLNNLKVDSNIYKTCIKIARFYADSAYEKSLIYFNRALEVADRSSDRKKVANIYHQIGSMYQQKGEFSIALENFNNALEIHAFLNDKTGIGQLLNDIGIIYKTWGKYDKALENYLKALKIFDEIGDDVNGAMASNNIGQIYYYRSEFEKSITFFKKYLDINKRNKTMRAVAGAANNIASAYMELNKLDEALNYYIHSRGIYDSLGIKVGVAIINDNIGSLYLRKNLYSEALRYNTEALKTFEDIGNQSRLCASLQSVGIAYTKLKQPTLAIKSLNKSLQIALKLKQQETKKDVYETLSEVYTQTNQFDKAFKFYKLFIEIRDSLLNSENTSKIEAIQEKYESQKKEKDIAVINQKLESQKVLGLFSAGIIIVFLFLTTLIISENQKKKKIIKKSVEETNNLYQIINKINQKLVLNQNKNLVSSSIFEKSWCINSNKKSSCLCISTIKDSYLIIAFGSLGNNSNNEDLINLSVFDFFKSLNSLNFNSSIKEQYNSFIAKEPVWKKVFGDEQLMNIDFWLYNKDKKQHLYCGVLSAFFIDNNKQIKDLSLIKNTWLEVNKGDRLIFLTHSNLSSFILNEQSKNFSTINKTIANTLDLTFDEQKEILSNSFELNEAGNELQLGLTIIGYQF